MTGEEAEKRKAADGYQMGKRCAPRDIDNWPNPEIDPHVAASYPTRTPPTPYTNETPTHKIRIAFQDGHHPGDRDNLTDAQIGVGTPHEHDDHKRSPPEILDQDPKSARLNYLSEYRVPDSAPVYSQVAGGDQLGSSVEERVRDAENPENREHIRASKRKE